MHRLKATLMEKMVHFQMLIQAIVFQEFCQQTNLNLHLNLTTISLCLKPHLFLIMVMALIQFTDLQQAALTHQTEQFLKHTVLLLLQCSISLQVKPRWTELEFHLHLIVKQKHLQLLLREYIKMFQFHLNIIHIDLYQFIRTANNHIQQLFKTDLLIKNH